jgi:ribosome-binding factor A
MKTGRDKKIAEEIRREVSQIFHFELGDPRILGATVTGVKMTPDLRLARIYFALPGCEDRQEEVEQALQKSANYVRRLVAERIYIKYMPKIEFFYDESLEIELKLKDLFKEVSPPQGDEEESDE